MKTKILTFFLALIAVVVLAIDVRTIGDTSSVASRVVSTTPCKLHSICGYNGHSATQYLFIFEKGVAPTNGQAGKMGPFPVGSGQFYSVDFDGYGSDLDALTVGISTTANLFTNSATNSTIQAIISRVQP